MTADYKLRHTDASSRPPWAIRTFLAVVLVESGLIAYQWHERQRFDRDIASHMPTMAEPDRWDGVCTRFVWGVILGPCLSQIMLLYAGVWSATRIGDGECPRSLDISLVAVPIVFGLTVCWGALLGWAYMISAYD